MEKMRITNHNNRVKGNKHNDRNLTEKEKKEAKNIDFSRTKNNKYFVIQDDKFKNLSMSEFETFEEFEKDFYKKNFSSYCEKWNEKQKNKDRLKTPESLRTNIRTQLDEEILQIGDKDFHPSEKEFIEITKNYISWHKKTFPNCKIVDFAVHLDEATPHAHIRKCWLSNDEKTGELYPCQKYSLEQMGIKPPKENAPISKFNNAKQTYTKMCREQTISICKNYNLDIEKNPKEENKGKTTLEKEVYILKKQLDKLKTKYEELGEFSQNYKDIADEVKNDIKDTENILNINNNDIR